MMGIIVLFCIPGIVAFIQLMVFIGGGKNKHPLFKFFELLSVLVVPIVFLAILDIDLKNSCCSDSAFFSPEHRLTAYALIVLCIIPFVYSSLRKKLGSPIIELLTNIGLTLGVVFNIVLCIHAEEFFYALIGNVPIIILYLIRLIENQRLLLASDLNPGNSAVSQLAHKIVHLHPLVKFPLLILLCAPLLAIVSALLLLFGQKPDSSILMFTDTYKHGLSQLDHECIGVQCGGHYLCTVAAKGHKNVVKPQRLGIRNNGLVVCNRQLLVSNAFEELLEQKLPWLHKPIRKNYNKVGNRIHKHYHLFNYKWIADMVYLIMKPAEWIFLLTLYIFDQNPENRIAQQYLTLQERTKIKNDLSRAKSKQSSTQCN